MSILGKILQYGSLAAMPFTGGTSGLLAAGLSGAGAVGGAIDAAGKAAPVLGGMAGARADAHQAAERSQLGRDQLNTSAGVARDRSILDRAGVDLDRRKFQTAAPQARMSNSVRGSMLANARPISVGQGGPMTLGSGRSITPMHFGGFDPSMLSGNTRELGDAVTGQALEAQLKGDKFDPLTPANIPGATPAPEASGMDKLIGGAATGTSLMGAMGPILQRILAKRSTAQAPMPQVPGADGAMPDPRPPQNPAIFGGIKF